MSNICSFSKVISNLIFNSSSKISKGANVPEVKMIEYGALYLIISLNPIPGLKQKIFNFIIFLILLWLFWTFSSFKQKPYEFIISWSSI